MEQEALRIPKLLKPVTLWVHPEGRVVGSLFLHPQSARGLGEEQPFEVLNHVVPFVVVRCDDPQGIRFYSKRAIVRVEYRETQPLAESPGQVCLDCSLYMMDGALLSGIIKEALPPGQARLYDYININDQRFIKLHTGDSGLCLVNKAYIVRITPDNDT
jgi:hypothetical protein